MTQTDATRALHLVQNAARACRLVVAEKAQFELDQFDLDVEDAKQAILLATRLNVHKFEDHQTRSEKKVLVLRLPLGARTAYCKISLRLDQDHDPCLISFHPWGHA